MACQDCQGEYDVYSLVWDPEREGWADGPAGLHFVLSEGRTVVGTVLYRTALVLYDKYRVQCLALPMATLTESAAQVAGVTVVSDAVRGRAAALAEGEAGRVIDFYPERPGD